jgi:tetratricopeptide (TPR) repeat protein
MTPVNKYRTCFPRPIVVIASWMIFTIVGSFAFHVYAQTPMNPIDQGKQFFQNSSFREALSLFRDSLSDPRMVSQRNEAYFWTAKTLFALGRYDEAIRGFDFFLNEYSNDRNAAEALFLQARSYFLLNDFSGAIQLFNRMISTHTRSPFIPNAFYWAGESYLALGNLEEALRLFEIVVSQFPTAGRFEAARYRIDVIRLQQRENQLVTLMRWIQEDSLRVSEAQVREITSLRQAIQTLQASAPGQPSAQSQQLQNQLQGVQNQLQQAQQTINQLTQENRDAFIQVQNLQSQLEQTQRQLTNQTRIAQTSVEEDAQRLQRLMRLQQQTLDLKEQVLRTILEEIQ